MLVESGLIRWQDVGVELRKCPFCGIIPRFKRTVRWPDWSDEGVKGWSVVCRNTNCIIYDCDTKWWQKYEDAAKEWNSRKG